MYTLSFGVGQNFEDIIFYVPLCKEWYTYTFTVTVRSHFQSSVNDYIGEKHILMLILYRSENVSLGCPKNESSCFNLTRQLINNKVVVT